MDKNIFFIWQVKGGNEKVDVNQHQSKILKYTKISLDIGQQYPMKQQQLSNLCLDKIKHE